MIIRNARVQLANSQLIRQTQRRALAVPVNPSSSVDALLGTSLPPSPREGEDYTQALTHRTNNPNDLSEFLRPNRYDAFGKGKERSGGTHAELQRVRGTAIGAERKGIPIPSRDEMLDNMFNSSESVVDREHPHPIDALHGRNELDERILTAARALLSVSASSPTYKAATIRQLLDRFEQKANYQLSIELPYEPTPTTDRKVPLTSACSSEQELQGAKDDGVLLVAYVSNIKSGRGEERISVCSGFAIQGGQSISTEDGDGKGHLLVTCAHTLRASESRFATSTSNLGDSVAMAITRTGAIYPVRTLVSSLPASDMVLMQLGEEPLPLHDGGSVQPLRTLPVSPYPAQVNSELSVSSFWGWEDDSGAILPPYVFDNHNLSITQSPPPPTGRDRETVAMERDDAGRSRWGRARLVEYKDPMGAAATVGTYDELAQLDYKLLVSSPANPPALQGDSALRMSSPASGGNQPSSSKTRQPLPNFPPPGSSGGPVVDVETGSVVGVVRGHKMSPLEGRRGDAIPAEKVFECKCTTDSLLCVLRSAYDPPCLHSLCITRPGQKELKLRRIAFLCFYNACAVTGDYHKSRRSSRAARPARLFRPQECFCISCCICLDCRASLASGATSDMNSGLQPNFLASFDLVFVRGSAFLNC